ncbi:MAG: sporulation integral membrane protein YtvI [Oscillospiraceae bacterium]|nr:sporulation integral membrane protein YtvI [Oscillospiraceae bacterium]
MERRRNFIVSALYWAVIAAVIYIACRWLLRLIWPFLCAFLFAWLLQTPIRFLTAKRHMRYSLSTALCLTMFFAVLGGILAALTASAVSGLQELMQYLPGLYTDVIKPGLDSMGERLERSIFRTHPTASSFLTEHLPDIAASVSSALANIPIQAVTVVSNWASRLPGQLLSTVICVIATVFITADFSRISAFLLRQMPKRIQRLTLEARDSAVHVLRSYCRSYGIIMCITFAELAVGLLLLRQKHAVLIALIVAALDIFPILGTGLVLVPWGIVTLLAGSAAKGIGLLTLWLVILVVRQIIEPRILGHQVGLHPIVTLIAMCLGARLFGPMGLLLLPIICAVLKSLDDAGVIHLVRHGDDANDISD